MKDAVLIELAATWELQAATGGDGLNKLQPAACETLRACADTLRMLVDDSPMAMGAVGREPGLEASGAVHTALPDVQEDVSQEAVPKGPGASPEASPSTPALPAIKGAWIDGGYVIVTPAGSGSDKAPAVKEAILRMFASAAAPSSETDQDKWAEEASKLLHTIDDLTAEVERLRAAAPSVEPLRAEHGTMDDFAEAADLVDKLGRCDSKGDMLFLVLGYRKAIRAALATPASVAVPPSPLPGFKLEVHPMFDGATQGFRVWMRLGGQSFVCYGPDSKDGCERWSHALLAAVPPSPLSDERIAEIVEDAWRLAENDTALGEAPETEWTRYGTNVARAVLAAVDTPISVPLGDSFFDVPSQVVTLENDGHPVTSGSVLPDASSQAALQTKPIGTGNTDLMRVVEHILDAGHMNTEDLARLRAAWEQT